MKKIISVEILVYGMPCLYNKFKEDGFTMHEKKVKVNKKNIKRKFDTSQLILGNTFQKENKFGEIYYAYTYLKNIGDIILEIPKEIENDNDLILKYVKENGFKFKTKELLIKMRLLYCTRVSFPIFEYKIKNEDSTIFNIYRVTFGFPSKASLFDPEMEKYNDKYIYKFNLKSLLDLCKKDIKFKRAIDLYSNSFDLEKSPSSFILLFTSLESLLLENGSRLKKIMLANRISTLLYSYDDVEKEKCHKDVGDLYALRSKYIHGEKDEIINQKDWNKLVYITRNTLLLYWLMKLYYNNINVIKFLKNYISENDERVDFKQDFLCAAVYITKNNNPQDNFEICKKLTESKNQKEE